MEGIDWKSVFQWSAGIIFSLSVVIEISPIKLNPWKHILKWIGQAVNGELIKKVDDMNADLQGFKKDCEERNAKLLRSHILGFGDELLHEQHHSKESFDQILMEINEYEQYCDDHQDFKNNVAKLTIKRIKAVYEHCMEEGGFIL